MRRTPYINEQSQGHSAIVNELIFDAATGTETTTWIPKESVKEYVTYTPQIIARQNGVTVTPEEIGALSAKVEVPSDASRISYKYRITENGHFYIPNIMPGKEGVRKIVVDVHVDDLMEDGIAYKNGEYLPQGGYGFKTFRTEVRKELPPNPRPEEVYEEEYVTENGQITPPEGYIGIKKLKVNVERDRKLNWNRIPPMVPMSFGSCAAVTDADGILNIFQENQQIKMKEVVDIVVLNFDTTGLSAFLLDGAIHLVGCSTEGGNPVHKVKNANYWVDGDTAALPQSLISPNIVQNGDVVYIVGSGVSTYSSGTGDCSTKVYKYENGVWSEAFDLEDPIYNTMDAAFMYGRIHVWTVSGHISYDPDTGDVDIEEENFNRLFVSLNYKLVPVSTDEVLMVHGRDSHEQAYSSIIYCKRTADGRYIYKSMGWTPYIRFFGQNQFGFGQNALMVGDELYVFGAEGQRVNTHYKASWQFFI